MVNCVKRLRVLIKKETLTKELNRKRTREKEIKGLVKETTKKQKSKKIYLPINNE